MKTPKAGLPHPHLVFKLCKEVRVQWVEGEELLHPKKAINNNTFDVYKMIIRDSEVGLSIPTRSRTLTQRLTALEE